MKLIRVGVDLAKNVFQVHGVDAVGQVIVRKKLRRSEVLGFFRRRPEVVTMAELAASPATGPED